MAIRATQDQKQWTENRSNNKSLSLSSKSSSKKRPARQKNPLRNSRWRLLTTRYRSHSLSKKVNSNNLSLAKSSPTMVRAKTKNKMSKSSWNSSRSKCNLLKCKKWVTWVTWVINKRWRR